MTGTYVEAHGFEESQVGVTETGGPDGHSGNIVPYWIYIGLPNLEGKSWCGAFQDAMAKDIGLKLPGSMVSTHIGAAAFDRVGRFTHDRNGGQPGDMVFYAWTGALTISNVDHIEWLEKPQPNGTNTVIGGNTSNVGDYGPAQRNGGCVAKRNRDRSRVVGYGRPEYAKPLPPSKRPIVIKHNPFNHADDLVRWTQWALGIPVTGKPTGPTWPALRAFQARQRIVEPHYPGPKTIAALSVITHAT